MRISVMFSKLFSQVIQNLILVVYFTVSVIAYELPKNGVLDPQPSGESVLAKIYHENAPSVVYVTGINVQPTKKSPDEFFNPSDSTHEEHTVGTGFIIQKNGYIITNAHAVTRSLVPEIELQNGRRWKAEIAALIPQEDLALLKISVPEELHAVCVEPNPNLAVGDTVVTIGCPHGLKFTLSYGIISAKDRSSTVTDIPGLVLHGLLQTDAAINPGSSGGPWFNLYGRVMGMTVSKRGDSDNIAFGVSLETIHYQFPRMLHRAAKRLWELPCEVTGSRKTGNHHARITRIQNDFAQQWNLQDGETITKINGVEIFTAIEFYQQLLSMQTGETVTLTLEREGTECTFTLNPRKIPDAASVIWNRLAMKVQPISQEKLSTFNLRVGTGLELTEVNTERFKGLKYIPKPGDILARINYERPDSPEHLAEILENISPNSTMDLVILRRETVNQKPTFTRIDINHWK